MRIIRSFTAWCTLLGCTLVLASFLHAHTEPPKTQDELIQKEKARASVAQHKVKIQHAWVILESTPSRPADSMLWQSSHFDQRGNLIEQVTFDSLGVTRFMSKYGEKNIWLEELIYADDSLQDRTVFVYRPDGLIHQILSFDVTGALTGKLDYGYNVAAREITVVKHTDQDSLLYTIVYSYAPGDDLRDNIASKQTAADGTLMVSVENKFEGTSRVSKTVFAPDGSVNRIFSYSYTEDGEYDEIATLNAAGTMLSLQTYVYSDDGLLTQLITRNEAGKITKLIRYHYEYFKDPLSNG